MQKHLFQQNPSKIFEEVLSDSVFLLFSRYDSSQSTEILNRLHHFFAEILERHGLIEHFERRQSNNVPDENESWKDADGKVGDWQALKMDAKLGKLWKKAKATGFTGENSLAIMTLSLVHNRRHWFTDTCEIVH